MKAPLSISWRHSFRLLVSLGLLIFSMSHPTFLRAQTAQADFGLTAHEWGTFTSVAGQDGHAVEWSPLTGSTDLPGFVEHFRSPNFKFGLRGTVRMETPVLYFYSSHDVTLSVRVAFAKGLITEWYPHASVEPINSNSPIADAVLYEKRGNGSITWDAVTLEPGTNAVLTREASKYNNYYYAARATSATQLRVKSPGGDQREKFLFYRGVSTFAPPVAVTVRRDGMMAVKNLSKSEIPAVILFERRGDKLGYRMSGSLGSGSETLLAPLELASSVEALYADLENVLIQRGLYRDEAHAMLETWRDSWFEEGSRVFYIVPSEFVDSILPLSIRPAPAQTVRVFVGRMEVITAATEHAVQTAMARQDEVTLAKYQRFLDPIVAVIQEKQNANRPVQGEQ